MSASGASDEKKLRQCFETLITDISQAQNEISQLKKNDNDEPILQKLQKKIQTSFEKSLPAPSGNYLLRVLNKYHYNDQTRTFSFSLTAESLPSFLYDLQSYLSLFDACQGAWNGDLPTVKKFMDNYSPLKDASGPRKTTLLYSAARNNHINIVAYLIEIGHCSVNAQNEEYVGKGQQPTMSAAIGSTALHAACFQGHLQVVKYLIEHGGDYFLLNSVHETPFANGQSKANIGNFFSDLLLSGYSKASSHVPDRTILQSLEQNLEPFSDCIWEYKSMSDDRWIQFTSDLPNQLQQALIAQPFQAEIQSKSARDAYQISLAQFLRTGKNNELAWIRCRGSSLLNLRAYSQWQMMFTKHPAGTTDASSSIQILQIPTKKIQLQTWYNFDAPMNFVIETAMNYRRNYFTMKLDFLKQEKILFDLEKFTFTNQQNTIEGSLRWIPKIVTNDRKFTAVDNFKLPKKGDLTLLTVARIKQAQHDQTIPEDIDEQCQLKSEHAFKNDDLSFENTKSTVVKDSSSNMIEVIQGDLLVNESDILVICSSSRYLFDSIMRVGGKPLKESFDTQVRQKGKNTALVSVLASGQLNSKAVYFVRWEPDPNPTRLCRSIEHLVTAVMETAAHENYRSIAFPAIGCGEYGCSVDLVAQTFVKQVQRQLAHHPIKVLFVIQPDRRDIYDQFQSQLTPSESHESKTTFTMSSSIKVGKGSIEIEKGDITQQQVDVIIGSSSSENLRQILLKAGGEEVQTAYANEFKNNPNALIISTPPGQLSCKRLFFLKWEPDSDEEVLRQSIVDMIWNLVQNVLSHNFTSIAFPAIGCGEHACSVDIVVKTTVREMKQQIQKRKLPWTVKFIIHPNQENVYDEFCRQLLSSEQESVDYQVPSTWQHSKDDSVRALVAKNTEESKLLVTNFDQTMRGIYKHVIKIERIQNERWYMQYVAHARDFKKRLNEDTEKHLYHGCPETAVDAIMEDCFNRSFAGVNGIAYGVGVYFSANAAYSHGFAKPNPSGERHMFVARVLVGKTTIGNTSMKTRPLGFDSTTDGNEIFVTYHDAQAYAEYLITYK